jgi:hypothetical protein
MAGTRHVVAWAAALAFGLATLGLGIYLIQLGLTEALAVATVVGAFTGLIGLGVSVFGLIAARANSSSPAPGPVVSDSRIGAIVTIGRARKVITKNNGHG